MAEDSGREHDPHRDEEHAQHEAGQSSGSLDGLQASSILPASPGTLLGNPALKGRGNGPVRAAVLQRMQQNYGNRATQRFLQRVAHASTHPAGEEDIAGRIQAKGGSGSKLEPEAKSRLEAGLGADLSDVRVHTDGEADQLARSVDAVAFISGRDVFFREGTYSPGSQEGLRLLAHETSHVTQQARGPVPGTPLPGGIMVSDPSDSFEQAAEQAAERVMSGDKVWASVGEERNGETSQPTAGHATTGLAPIQRYQAGKVGHGGVEQEAMQEAGFSAHEANQIYFGNWLRDFSQLTPKLEKMPELKAPMLEVLNVLSLGEFNREFNMDQLGTYTATEHLDNPVGSGAIEDPEIQKDPAKLEEAYNKLSPSQRVMYDEVERRFQAQKDSKASKLPEYLQKGIIRAKLKLEEAIREGRTPNGMLALGDALHAVEDYFSHSNFVSVAIAILQREKKAPPSLSEAKAKADVVANADTAMPDEKGNLQVVTGTYATGADAQISILEAIKTALTSDEMSKALALGLMRKLGITPEQIAQKLGGGIGSALGRGIGAVTGGISEGASGAASGAAEGWNRNSGWGALTGAAEGLITGGATGLLEGSEEGSRAGEAQGAAIGEAAGGAALSEMRLAGKTLDQILDVTGVSKIVAAFPELNIKKRVLGGLIEMVIEKLTAQSGEDARKMAEEAEKRGDKKGAAALRGPTHSELSKDAPDAALYGASVALAKAADKEIGEAIRKLWGPAPASPGASGSTGAPPSATPQPAPQQTPPGAMPAKVGSSAPPPAALPGSDAVTSLVDKYISHPESNRWWEPTVIAAANRPGGRD